MLEHVGRSTGRRRFVVLEVIARQNRKRYVVMSGRGPRAQWLRNVRADPHVRIDIGARRGVPAVARELDRTETDVTLDLYARDHPRAWPMIRAVLIRTSGVDVGIAQQTLPVVEFRLDGPDLLGRRRRGWADRAGVILIDRLGLSRADGRKPLSVRLRWRNKA